MINNVSFAVLHDIGQRGFWNDAGLSGTWRLTVKRISIVRNAGDVNQSFKQLCVSTSMGGLLYRRQLPSCRIPVVDKVWP